jgi:hypothetical protein
LIKITDEVHQVEELLGVENTGKKIFQEYMDAINARWHADQAVGRHGTPATLETLRRANERFEKARTALRQAQGFDE